MRRFTSVGRAASLTFAGVLGLASVVTGLTSALALTFVLAFTRVFALFSVSYCLERDTGFARRRRGEARTAKDPLKRPATAAAAITALDGLIID